MIYSAITSLDGYVADSSGNFDWATPDDELHAAVNDFERRIGTYLYGRRMYEVMKAWETIDTAEESPVMQDYARIWRAAAKIVFSTTLTDVSSAQPRIERRFDPDAIRRLKATEPRDIGIGGPGLASHAIRAGLVDHFRLFVNPVVVGGGTRAFADDLRVDLRLVDERRFGNGVMQLSYVPAR